MNLQAIRGAITCLKNSSKSIDAAVRAAETWCDGQGLNSSLSQRAIGVEVMTHSGDWRTVSYPSDSLLPKGIR